MYDSLSLLLILNFKFPIPANLGNGLLITVTSELEFVKSENVKCIRPVT
jgi:hypothetical protein